MKATEKNDNSDDESKSFANLNLCSTSKDFLTNI